MMERILGAGLKRCGQWQAVMQHLLRDPYLFQPLLRWA